jgi:hypothetical protein
MDILSTAQNVNANVPPVKTPAITVWSVPETEFLLLNVDVQTVISSLKLKTLFATTLLTVLIQLVKFVTINVKLAKMLPLVSPVPPTPTESNHHNVSAKTDTMMMVPQSVNHVPTNVTLVTKPQVVTPVPKEESTPQNVLAQKDNMMMVPNASHVVPNVLLALEPPVLVTLATNQESKTHHLAHVQQVTMKPKDGAKNVTSNAKPVNINNQIVLSVPKTESMLLPVSVHPEPSMMVTMPPVHLVPTNV